VIHAVLKLIVARKIYIDTIGNETMIMTLLTCDSIIRHTTRN